MAARSGAVSVTVFGNDGGNGEDQPDKHGGDYQQNDHGSNFATRQLLPPVAGKP